MFQPLQRGDKIGIFSSSVPATSTAKLRYDRGKEFLQAKGYQLLRDPSIKMIMSSIGGTNSNSLLPYIDYEAFKNNPKIVIGYSDTTAILLALFAKTNIPTYYGPALIPSFGEFEPLVHETYNYFKHYFSQPSVPYMIPMSPVWSDEMINWLTFEKPKTLYSNKWISIHEGVVEGRLIGGNNNTMYGFIGTPYFPVIKNGDILLIEDSLKSASTVEKNLAMLKLHGIFDKVGGIILGKHELFDDEGTGKQPLDLLLEQLDGKIIPILADVDCAHTHPMFPLAIGKKIRLDTITQTITCIEHWL
ncbi:uncharacterized protein, homologs of microcin C7 resistance protein MccF [Solibacillus silvestris StLB046]|uniref:Uncharacterized protein, homologs of microcin C7 resistance protein MccF n=1 Tax=Solibacillus silvestris (strain StLB046) TaxID=1002809 RepID=F2F610_SOLSS|nr:S66 peptidase family protein [Solibacillus silvestris]BAK17093.1 uncharacterized protein, homologs of microcin C7 resistance protein MccF [Solibacillus silvestris StLB046]